MKITSKEFEKTLKGVLPLVDREAERLEHAEKEQKKNKMAMLAQNSRRQWGLIVSYSNHIRRYLEGIRPDEE